MSDNSLIQDDLRKLLDALGLFSGARPQTPHEVMLEAIAEAARLRRSHSWCCDYISALEKRVVTTAAIDACVKEANEADERQRAAERSDARARDGWREMLWRGLRTSSRDRAKYSRDRRSPRPQDAPKEPR